MAAFRETAFQDRLKSQQTARQAMLERYRSRPSEDDPAVAERLAQRQAVVAAREARRAEKEAAKAAERARLEEERRLREEEEARLEALRLAEEEERLAKERAEAEARNSQIAMLLAQQKAARDARYAARKARR
jgi:hypothetical protein